MSMRLKMNELYNKLPLEGRKYFDKVYNESLKRNPPSVAEEVATTMVKNKLISKGNTLVAMSDAFIPTKAVTFVLEECETKVIANSENEEFVIEAVLADTNRNAEGVYFTDMELEDISQQINTLGSTIPDVDHEKLNALVEKYGDNPEAILAELRNDKSVFKTIKSVLSKGRLWIQAKLDKRYKKYADQFKSLSIEAFGKVDASGRVRNPKYAGFTFTNNPKLKSVANTVSVVA